MRPSCPPPSTPTTAVRERPEGLLLVLCVGDGGAKGGGQHQQHAHRVWNDNRSAGGSCWCRGHTASAAAAAAPTGQACCLLSLSHLTAVNGLSAAAAVVAVAPLLLLTTAAATAALGCMSACDSPARLRGCWWMATDFKQRWVCTRGLGDRC